MRRPDLPIIGLLGIVLVGAVLLTRTDRTDAPPAATRVVATITTIDRTTGLATLQTAQGERFALPTAALWQVGDRAAVTGSGRACGPGCTCVGRGRECWR